MKGHLVEENSCHRKTGRGKSSLSRKLAELKGIRLIHLDSIEYDQSGNKIPLEDYYETHNSLINSNEWIIDGFGPLDSFWQRIEAADAVVYVDLPYRVHYWWVNKAFYLREYIKKPEGWPKGSSIIKGTLAGYKYFESCRQSFGPINWNRKLSGEVVRINFIR